MGTDPINLKQYRGWARGAARIEGDEIVLDEEVAEEYFRDESDHWNQLLPDFAALRADDPQSAVGFASRHGLLWHGPEHLGSGECRESLLDWRIAATALNVFIGLYINLEDADLMRNYLSGLRADGMFWQRIPDDDRLCLEFASAELAGGITRGLQGCSWTITAACTLTTDGRKAGGSRDFLLGDDSPNLEAAAYAQFATLIANKAPFHECEGCGIMFSPDHGRQRYCTLQCNARVRKARQRAKGA
jgi:hypothetical protein